MTGFQRGMAIACFMLIGAGAWTLILFALPGVQGDRILGFFLGALWWELAKIIWPGRSPHLPLLESGVAWKVTSLELDQPVGIPTLKKEGSK